MNWDEFKATKDTKGKMAFIITDNDNNNIFDIQDSRKSRDLEKYFKRYPKSERDKVKLISMDFYTDYIYTAKKLFKNADIIIDRFYIVTQVYVELNSTRVSLCKKDNHNYNKLKNLWKLILKNEYDLSDEKKYSSHFHKDISQRNMVTYMVNTDNISKVTYECYQDIINSIKNKDFNKFKSIVEHQNNYISSKMKRTLNLYKNNLKYIENSFKYDINNGIIEEKNNLIKSLKKLPLVIKNMIIL